jgi:hypothetical protein
MPVHAMWMRMSSETHYRTLTVKMTRALPGARRLIVPMAASLLLHILVLDWGRGDESVIPAPVSRVALVQLRPAPPAQAKTAATPEAAPQRARANATTSERQVQSGKARPRYQASLPGPVQLKFDLLRLGANGAASGIAELVWQRDGDSYRLQHVASIHAPLAERLSEMSSAGHIGTAGIVPRTMTERRRNRSRTATHFDAQAGITFSASQRAVAMAAGAQDKASWPMQLAGIARAGTQQLAGGVELLVGEDKDASVYRFVVLGQEMIETGIGTLATWHLARLAQPGTYNARLDVWLAPEHEWYPVQLRTTEANGTMTTQTIREIVFTEVGTE